MSPVKSTKSATKEKMLAETKKQAQIAASQNELDVYGRLDQERQRQERLSTLVYERSVADSTRGFEQQRQILDDDTRRRIALMNATNSRVPPLSLPFPPPLAEFSDMTACQPCRPVAMAQFTEDEYRNYVAFKQQSSSGGA